MELLILKEIMLFKENLIIKNQGKEYNLQGNNLWNYLIKLKRNISDKKNNLLIDHKLK